MRIRYTHHAQFAQIIEIKILDREGAFLFHLDNWGADKLLIFENFEIFGKLQPKNENIIDITRIFMQI